MKETVFNWLMPYINDSVCLDMFAGSGSLGLEALSRYAKYCAFIEQDKATANGISQNLKILKVADACCQVVQGDAISLSKNLDTKFDIIFVDPPFQQGLVVEAINAIVEGNLLSADGLIYIECEKQNANYPVPENWQRIKQKSTQSVSSCLYCAQV